MDLDRPGSRITSTPLAMTSGSSASLQKPRNVKNLRAPNQWSKGPVLEADLDLYGLTAQPATLCSLIQELQNREERGARVAGTPGLSELARAIGQLASDLQQVACRELSPPYVEPLERPGEFRLALPCEEFLVAELALQLALSAAHKILCGEAWDWASSLNQVCVAAERWCSGPSTFAILAAARRRGIPVDRWGDNSLLRLGQGCRQRRMWTGVSDQTNSLADSIVKDKELTRQLLGSCGLPVPRGQPVESVNAAWQTACELGLPVAVKPRDGNHSRGVGLNLTTRVQIENAYRAAAVEGPVMVEEMVPGQEHRVLVVDGRVVAAAVRLPAQVRGDGEHTVTELVQMVNRDCRRGSSPFSPMRPLNIDDVARDHLAEQGLCSDSIPAAGQSVLLRRISSITRGGTARDVTASIHPEVTAACVTAAQVVGLDIAGIDVVAINLSQPLTTQRGAIVEVNAGPGLNMHLDPWPAVEPVGEAILDYLFPAPASTARIPIVAIRGNQATKLCQQLSAALRRRLIHVGTVCGAGWFLNSRELPATVLPVAERVRRLLWNPQLQALVFEVIDDQVLETGLGVEQVDWLLDATQSNLAAESRVTRLLSALLPDDTRRMEYVINPWPESLIQQICECVTACGRDETSATNTQTHRNFLPRWIGHPG